MSRLIVRRLMTALITLCLVSVLVFLATAVLPGDAADVALGQAALTETVEAMRRDLGLDQPVMLRYFAWGWQMLQGDFGRTAAGLPVIEVISDRLGNTMLLAGLTALVALPVATLLGVLAAMHPRSWLDRILSSGALTLASVPEFLLATVLINVFAVKLQLFPPIAFLPTGAGFGQILQGLSLPIVTLACFVGAQITRMTRAALLNILGRDFIEMAIFKGQPRSTIILRHALPNVIGPLANIIALALAYLVSGVVVVETIFAFPGLARLMVEAVQLRDTALVQACAMLFCLAYILLIALADMIQIAANPRLRTSRR